MEIPNVLPREVEILIKKSRKLLDFNYIKIGKKNMLHSINKFYHFDSKIKIKIYVTSIFKISDN